MEISKSLRKVREVLRVCQEIIRAHMVSKAVEQTLKPVLVPEIRNEFLEVVLHAKLVCLHLFFAVDVQLTFCTISFRRSSLVVRVKSKFT